VQVGSTELHINKPGLIHLRWETNVEGAERECGNSSKVGDLSANPRGESYSVRAMPALRLEPSSPSTSPNICLRNLQRDLRDI
jgi:hypothetical protein